MICNPKSIILPASGNERIVHRNGDTMDIVNTVLLADRQSDKYINKRAVKCLVGRNSKETIKNVWSFVRKNVQYVADRPGKEVIKSPGALFHQFGSGDCKSFSVAAAALLRALGFTGVYFRFAAYRNNPDFTHVYVVVQLPSGEVIVDATPPSGFDQEANYTKYQDYTATGGRQSAVSGYTYSQPAQTAVNGPISTYVGALTIGVILFATYYLLSND